jgi:hypothetical protein
VSQTLGALEGSKNVLSPRSDGLIRTFVTNTLIGSRLKSNRNPRLLFAQENLSHRRAGGYRKCRASSSKRFAPFV